MPDNTKVLPHPPAAIYRVPPVDNAQRQCVELFGSALVTNAYLRIAVLALSVVACTLVFLNVYTAPRRADQAARHPHR